MGLSSKQVSGDMLDWGQNLLQSGTLELPKTFPMKRQQQQQQQSEPLKCPRCASTNTKFCYYNNYNKTQPRHFCKSCKRHWTKGGTLRNVPVGGGRKNKRLKTSNTTINSDVNNRISTTNTRMATDQNQQEYPNLPLALDHEQKGPSHILSQALIRPPYSMQHDAINNFSGKSSSNNNNGVFLGSGLTLPLHDFLFSSSSSFGSNPSSISTCFESSNNVYDYIGGIEAMKDSIITSILPTTTSSSIITQPWQVPKTSTVMDMPTSYWSGTNWDDDFETFVSSTDLNIPWDDSDVKPC